jgi:hypothetical protein
MGSDPEKAAEYERTWDNLMVGTERKLSAELRVIVTRAVQAGLTQDEIDDQGPAGALDQGGFVFEDKPPQWPTCTRCISATGGIGVACFNFESALEWRGRGQPNGQRSELPPGHQPAARGRAQASLRVRCPQ